jgi:hypothetical protein
MRRFLVLFITAALVLAACSSGGSKKKPAAVSSTTSSTSATAVTGQAFSPEPKSTQGVSGTGIVVDVAFRSKDPTLVKAGIRTSGPGRPGRNAAFPGLVITLSTTDASLGGPQANLADLFQIVSVSQQEDGSAEVWATWVNAAAKFGVDVDSVLEAYVVRGDAPATVPADRNGLDVVSNVLNVSFHIAGLAAGGTSTSSSSSVPAASTTSRVATTTTRLTTTTKATTTTIKATTTSASSTPPST